MTGKLSLGARVACGVLSLSALFQLAAIAAESSSESRPLRRWLASRQQRAADAAADAPKADDDARARSWRQDPRYQYRGVFENWNAFPNDSYGGRPSMYQLPPPAAYQKMYGPPDGYPQTQPRGLGSRFSSARNAKTNDAAEQSSAPADGPWAPRAPETLPLAAPVPTPLALPVPPAPLPLERSLKPLHDASAAQIPAPMPATTSPAVAKPADSRPKSVELTPSAPAKPSGSSLMTMPDFDFPDPPAAKR